MSCVHRHLSLCALSGDCSDRCAVCVAGVYVFVAGFDQRENIIFMLTDVRRKNVAIRKRKSGERNKIERTLFKINRPSGSRGYHPRLLT